MFLLKTGSEFLLGIKPAPQISVSGLAEAGVAKQFQPMRVGLPCQ